MEKRAYERHHLAIPVTVVVAVGVEHVGIARDISLGGMFVETEGTIPLGSVVAVVARLPGAEVESRLPARARWSKANGIGLQFGLIGAHDTHAILELSREKSAGR